MNQINVVKEVMDELHLNLNLCGLVKDDKHNTRGLMDINGNVIDIDKHSDLFYFLVRMQDEVHRFAITSHRSKRSKSLTSSILDTIKGLGKKRKEDLIKAYGTISSIASATIEELSQYVPYNVAKEIKEKLNNHN